MDAVARIPAAAAGWAGQGLTGEQQEWVPYGHHLHRRVVFFPSKSMLHSWLLSQHGCIAGIPELLAGSKGRRGLPGSLATRCNFATGLEVGEQPG